MDISRQVLYKLCEAVFDTGYNSGCHDEKDKIIDLINDLPFVPKKADRFSHTAFRNYLKMFEVD